MSIDEAKLFQAIETRARKELVPKLKVVPKGQVWLHRVINVLLNVIYGKAGKDRYKNRFTTTFGYTVALAENHGSDPKDFTCWETLCHEVKHAQQGKKWTRPLFGYLYMWPLSQGVLLFLLCWLPVFWAAGWWLALWIAGWVVLAGLHFIPQLPDPWRKHWELQGYSISLHLENLVKNGIPASSVTHVAEQFHSMAYYIMAPNRERIISRLKRISVRIQLNNSPVKDEPIVKLAEEEYRKCLAESK